MAAEKQPKRDPLSERHGLTPLEPRSKAIKTLDFSPLIYDNLSSRAIVPKLIYSPLDLPQGLWRGFAFLGLHAGRETAHAC